MPYGPGWHMRYTHRDWYTGKVISGIPLGFNHDNTQYYGGTISQGLVGANGDEIRFTNILLEAGEFQFSILGIRTPVEGIQEVRFDDQLIATFDWFSPVVVRKHVFTAMFNSTFRGDHSLRSRISGSTGGGFRLLVNAFWIDDP